MTLAALRRAAEAEPANAAALSALGTALIRRGERGTGLQYLRRAASVAGNVPECHWRLGVHLFNRGELKEAAERFECALRLDPTCEAALDKLAWLYSLRFGEDETDAARHERNEAARRLFLRGLTLSPSRASYHHGLCRTFVEEGGTVPALLRRITHAVSEGHDPGTIRLGMAKALSHYGRYEDARAVLEDLERRWTLDVDALLLRTSVEDGLGNSAAAERYARDAHVRYPSHSLAAGRYLQLLIRHGEHGRARDAYRREQTQRALFGPGSDRRWTGSRLAGKTILFRTASGGFGDMFHWSRFASLMGDSGANALVECGEPVRELLATLPNVTAVVVPYDEPRPYDFFCDALASILLLDWDWSTMARQVPYLTPPRTRIEFWTARVGGCDALHVGLAWRAAVELPSRDDCYTARSLPLHYLQPLVQTPGVVFHSLSVGPLVEAELHAASPPLAIERLPPDCEGFTDVAAAIVAFDLVITVDTAFAHLAGALGKPCLLLLPCLANWRWLRDGVECAWYPQVRMLRQPAPGDWRAVVAAARAEVLARRDRKAASTAQAQADRSGIRDVW